MLTREQFDSLRAKGLTVEQIVRFEGGETPKQSLLQQAVSDIKQTGSALKNTFTDTMNKLGQATAAEKSGEQGMARTALQKTGAVAGGLSSAVGDVVMGGAKTLLPKSAEQAVKSGLQKSVSAIAPIAKKIDESMGSPAGTWLNNYKNLDPKTKRDVDALFGIGNLALDIATAGTTKKAGQEAIKTVVQGAEKTGTKLVSAGTQAVENTKSLVTKGLEKATDVVSPIEKGVQTVLENPTVRKAVKIKKLDDYEKAAKQAIVDYSKPTPMELAGNKAAEAMGKIQSGLKKVGETKRAVTTNLAKTNTGEIVNEAKQSLRSLLKERAGLALTENGKFKNASNRLSSVSDPNDLKLIKDIDFKLSTLVKSPTFQRVDDAIDWIQDKLYKRTAMTAVPVNGKVEGIIKNLTTELNSKLKNIGGAEYASLNDSYSSGKKVFDKLNKALGAEGNKGAALMKQLFSPSGTAPRKLFEQVKALTGVDLVDEATLAKFVMENIGDVRQASLLEQVIKGSVNPTNAKGITRALIDFAAEKTINKLNKPLEKGRRMILKSTK